MMRSRTLSMTNIWIEIIIRAGFAYAFFHFQTIAPFERKIQPDELWLYRNPRTDSYVTERMLWPLVLGGPLLMFFVSFLVTRNKVDFIQSHLALTLSLGLNAVLTDVLKLTVGRPRPDFFWRCFPDGQMNSEMQCTGNEAVIRDGRKSFPSGHSSFSFASMCFLSLYAMGKLHVFNERGRGQTWRLLLTLIPLLLATLVAVSRTADYHHHYQDVIVGSLIGIVLAYLSYRQYYPPLSHPRSNQTYAEMRIQDLGDLSNHRIESAANSKAKSDLHLDKDSKWI